MNVDFVFGLVCGVALAGIGYAVYVQIIRRVLTEAQPPAPAPSIPQPEGEPIPPSAEEDTFEDETWDESPLPSYIDDPNYEWSTTELTSEFWVPPTRSRTPKKTTTKKTTTKKTSAKPRAKTAKSIVAKKKTR